MATIAFEFSTRNNVIQKKFHLHTKLSRWDLVFLSHPQETHSLHSNHELNVNENIPA